jgi:carbamoyl-phosphate synthase large subunit
MKPLSVLITGAGGPVGQGIIKAARQVSFPCRLIATDRDPLSVGFNWTDVCYLVPGARDPAYIPELAAICRNEGVHAVLVGSEPELLVLAQHKETFERASGARLIASSSDLLAVTMDKWKTVQFLATHHLDHPDSALPQDADRLAKLIDRHGYPLIVKPRNGSGSKGLFKVHNWQELNAALQTVERPVVQEYLEPDDQEYTTAVFVDPKGEPQGAIVMRRVLAAGLTYRAWVEDNPTVARAAQSIAQALKPVGPCNVQLRLTDRGPVAFEINARFSSSVAMRAHFGYNEVEMALRSFVLGETITAPAPRRGIALRFWEETYIEQPAADFEAAAHRRDKVKV